MLEFLLSVDFPGRPVLAEQARAVEVVGRWDGEPTIELSGLGFDRDEPVAVVQDGSAAEFGSELSSGEVALVDLVL